MKSTLKIIAVILLLALATSVNAQNSATATATANATIVCPLTILDKTDGTGNLEFGKITNTPSGGNLVVNTDGSTVYTNCSNFGGTPAGNVPHPAHFTVGGQSGFTYTINPTIVTDFTVGGAAQLSALTSSLGTIGTLPTGGGCVNQDLAIGGKITLTGLASGSYTATINVAVAYN